MARANGRESSLNSLNDATIIFPYYRNVAMLKRQVQEWKQYPPGVKVICVDDGSPEPAFPIIMRETYPWGPLGGCKTTDLLERLQLYRIEIDRPWNRSGARNLGSHVATTDWIIHVDIDHVLPADAAVALLDFTPNPKRWYRFPRWRRGKADETRKKDLIPDDLEYGQIHPHVDSYLVRREVYWKTGGYDEDFAGHLGGGNMFLKRLEKIQPVEMLPLPIRLEVYTRSEIKDASDWSLSRDKTENSKRRRMKEASGDVIPKNPLRFPWRREL